MLEVHAWARVAVSPPRQPCANQGAHILVVDDDPNSLSMVSDLLDLEGYAVYVATNGAEALVLLEWIAPRVILLDMRMPVLDGWGFARVLKEQGKHLPLLVMTAAIDASRSAAEIDAAAYVSKPYDLTHLLSVLERLLADH